MSGKPSSSPEKLQEAFGVRSGSKQDVYKVALYQKMLLLNIAVYIFLFLGLMAASCQSSLVTPQLKPVMSIASVVFKVNIIMGFVLVILLGVKVFHPINGVITAILVLVPLLGLLALLSINGKASKVLKENGFQVGLFGATLSKVRAWTDKEAIET